MINNDEKYDNYKIIYAKLNKALKNEFYLEAIFIEYAIMEDRLNSILVTAKKEKASQLSLARKLTSIKNYIQLQSSVLGCYLKLETLEIIQSWSMKRNQLIHALASRQHHDEIIKDLAIEGYVLTREVSKASRNFKNYVENNQRP